MKICLFNPGIEDNQGTPSSNLGDLIIEKSVRRELARFSGKPKIHSISTQAYPQARQLERILRSRLRVVGGTNLLSSKMDKYNQWKITPFQAALIRDAVLLGVGWWQYQDEPNKYTRRLLRRCLSDKWLHSVRDGYTLEKLRSIGIENAINTGCPTMWPLADYGPGDFPREKADSVLLMLTDYVSLHTKPELDATLVELLLEQYRTVYYWPQGRQDLGLISQWGNRLKILNHDISSLYSLIEGPEPLDYVGTRLHGGVACLLAKRRSLILQVDNRATEIAKETNLPSCARDDFDFVARWIKSPSETIIRMPAGAIRQWHEQFTLENLRCGRPMAMAKRPPEPAINSQPGKPLMLNLGCGKCYDTADWVNIDFITAGNEVISHDLRKALPVSSDICDVVYSSHVLEHFSRSEARAFLKECNRVLRPGGVLRIVVPDLEMIARLYLKYLDGAATGDTEAAARHEWMTIELLDQLTRERSGGEVLRYWQRKPIPAMDFVIERTGEELKRFISATKGIKKSSTIPSTADVDQVAEAKFLKFRATGENHKWMYDRVSLAALLERTGFTKVRQCNAGESAIKSFADYHLDTNPDGSIRKPDSLFVEATKC